VIRRSRGRKRAEIGSDVGPYRLRGDIEGEDMPMLDELRSIRIDHYSGSSTRCRSVRPSRMVTASISRSSLSGARTSSRHRHKSSRAYGSETGVKPRRTTRSSSRDEGSHVYVYGPPKAKDRSSTIRVTERRRSRHDDESDARDGVMSIVSEESEPDDKPKSPKVKVVYVEKGTSRSRKHHADEKRAGTKESSRSMHRSHTTASQRPSSAIQPFDALKRYSQSSANFTNVANRAVLQVPICARCSRIATAVEEKSYNQPCTYN
jgi:hypothetical protein